MLVAAAAEGDVGDLAGQVVTVGSVRAQPTAPFHCAVVRSCQVAGGLVTLVLS
ncbi:MAG: hypothetical protein ACRDOH_11950 [Streptosporangiaceae bacterium]